MIKGRAVVGFVLMLTACGGGAQLRLPVGPAHTEVVMDEFSFSAPGELGAGRVVFQVSNSGAIRHEVIVIEVPEGVSSLEEQLRSEERRATTTLSVIPPQEPGEGTVFALDLPSGRYGLLCFLKAGGDGKTPHALRGMNAEFEVR